PFLDRRSAYTRGKHREPGTSLGSVYAQRLSLIWHLRRLRIDYAVIGSCGFVPRALSFARLLRPRHIVSHVPVGRSIRGVDMPVPHDWEPPRHEVEDVYSVLDQLPGVPVVAHPSERLEALIAGLSVCERVICSDGGAMHIAAALGKPILCFFGNSGATRWRPWGVPHVLLQPPSLNAADIS